MWRLAFVALLGACTNFDYIEANQCGNGVVEDGEDCDVVTGEDEVGTCVACRYVCFDESGFGCPAGWGCGAADRVCRHASGEYEESSPALDVEVTDYLVVDLDGDPFPDALGFGPAEVWTARGTPGPGFELTARYPRTRGDVRPALGNLHLDPGVSSFGVSPDVAVSPGRRAVAMFTTDGGRLTPVPQTWFRLGAPAHVSAPVRTPASTPAADVVSYDLSAHGLWIDRPGEVMGPTLVLPVLLGGCNADDLQLVPTDLDGDDVDEVLVSCRGTTTVHVVDVTPVGLALVTSLTLPGALRGPLIVADLDGDTRADVLGTVSTGEIETDLAVFHQPATMTFTTAAIDGRAGSAIVLAAADLDGDGDAELVTSAGIEDTTPAPVTWTRAAIADVNADGHLDVVGLAAGELDTLLGTAAGTFATHVLLTTGEARAMAVGDLDGDGLADVATLWREDNADHVRILYGARDGGFDALVDAGALASTVTGFAVAAMVQADTLLVPDASAELIVTTEDDVAVFVGGAARPPVAPLDPTVDPRVLSLGRFNPLSGALVFDLFVLGDPGDPSVVWYGSFSRYRQLEDRHVMPDSTTGCVSPVAITAVGNIAGVGGESLVEIGCPTTFGVEARARHVSGEPELPELAGTTYWFIPSPYDAVAATIVDLDRDFADELIVVTDDVTEPVHILHNNGGNLDVARIIDVGDDLVTGVAVGNVDADADAELITNELFLRAYDYTADGVTDVVDGNGQGWSIDAHGAPRLADLDRDGVQDVVVGGDTLRVFRATPHDE